MKRKNKILTISVLAILLAIAGLLIFGKSKNKKNYTIQYATVERDTIAQIITATGTLNASQTVDVGTQVSGVISEIYTDYNEEVKKGQLIALIDTVSLAVAVSDAESGLLKAKAMAIQQQKEYDRSDGLFKKGILNESDFDLVKANYLSAQSNLKSAEILLKKARISLRYAYVNAPISGTIIARNVNVGQTVAASFATPTLFTIANDLHKMQLEAKIDEADIGKINREQEVWFYVDAYPEIRFTGKVRQIRLQPNTVQNVTTYTVIIDATNPDLKLLPGMSANISIVVNKRINALTVPLAALFFSPAGDSISGTKQVWIKSTAENNKDNILYNGETIRPVPVRTGIENGTVIEIEFTEEQLTEGTLVIMGIEETDLAVKKKSIFQPPKQNKQPSF